MSFSRAPLFRPSSDDDEVVADELEVRGQVAERGRIENARAKLSPGLKILLCCSSFRVVSGMSRHCF